MSVLERVLLAIVYLGMATLAVKTGSAPQPPEIKVAAAADLASAMDKLGPAFEKQTGIHLTVSLGSSGNFFAQIQNGAPFDVFLFADKSHRPAHAVDQRPQTRWCAVR